MNLIQTSFDFLISFSRPLVASKLPVVEPDLEKIWYKLASQYFSNCNHLFDYKITWSSRHQTQCLGSCNIQTKVVRIALAMKMPLATPYIEALIYHEMCHAVIGIKIKNGRRQIHTKEFKALESRHPEIELLNNWIKNGGWRKVVRQSMRKRNAIYPG